MSLSSHPLDRYRFETETFKPVELSRLTDLVAECEQKKKKAKICLACIVTDVKSAVSKTGKPWCRITVEDYSSSYEMSLFAKDYERFMRYLQLHNALFMEGEIDERYVPKPEDRAQGKTAPYAFRLQEVSLLGNVAENKVKSFSVDIDTTMLTQEFRKDFAKVIKTHQGKIPLNLFINDPATKYRIRFYSKKYQVEVSTDLVNCLKRLGINHYECEL
jgi:DNA polymerase-3 subunit alpha